MASSNSTHEFLSPVGGTPSPVDLAPSIVFAILYAFLLPVLVWRVSKPETRHVSQFGRIAFAIERVVSFSLRARAARTNTSLGLLTYFQTLYALGYITLSQDILTFYRTMLVDATLGSSMRARYEALRSKSKSKRKPRQDVESNSTTAVMPQTTEEQLEESSGPGDMVLRGGISFEEGKVAEDFPDTRARIRQLSGIGALLFLTAIALGVVAWMQFKSTVKSGGNAAMTQSLSYSSIGIALTVLTCISHSAVWLCFKMPRIRQTSAMWIVLLSALMSVVVIYRLVATRLTTSLFSADIPGTENSIGWKAAFYIFHIAPEFICTALLGILDVRRVFASGFLGDLRISDPKLS